MIDLGLEPTHISVEPGSKSDSIVLTIILEALKDGGKVIWMTRELPDQRRIIDILGNLNDTKLANLIVLEFKENLSGKLEEIKSILDSKNNEDLLIIENWCEKYGRAKSKEIILMKELEQYFNKFRIVITSYSYEDASGMNKDNQKFISRGGRIIQDLFRIIWITKIDGLNQKILIRDGENEFIAESTKTGYKFIN